MSLPTCSGTHKMRLFVGEGNFSYTEAFIKKHNSKFGHTLDQSLAHSITATELKEDLTSGCKECKEIETESIAQRLGALDVHSDESKHIEEPQKCAPCSIIIKRIETLKSMGTTIALGVNGASMSSDPRLSGKKFARIHWNCPHDGSDYRFQTLPKIIFNFFNQCSEMQDLGDRVHITLAQPAGQKNFRQGYVYKIFTASFKNNYVLIKKRKFESGRYPDYRHTQTCSRESASVTDSGMREFVFEKTDKERFNEMERSWENSPDSSNFFEHLSEHLSGISGKRQTICQETFYGKKRAYYDCSSDDDSSDCS